MLLWVVVAARRTALPGWRLVGQAVVAGLMTQGVQFLGLHWALARGVASGLGSSVIALNPVATAGMLSALTIAGLVRGAAACVLQARSGGPAGRRESGERDHAAERSALSRSAE